MSEWRHLGPVVTTQIHTDRMVNGGVYEHDMIVEAERLWLGPDGVIGDIDGSAVMHAHHRLHPNKTRVDNPKNYLPDRLLSFGFTSHYDAMAERFGQAKVGCAAEDVIVEHGEVVTLDELRGGLQLRRGDRVVDFVDPAIARPCVPFTKFLLQDQNAADDIVAPNRAFLDEGMRGFLVGLANRHEVVDVQVGDELWVRGEAS